MLFMDRLTFDAPRKTKDGFLAVRARAARTGVYEYAGREIDPDNAHGLRDQALVNVLRDEKTVFDTAAVRSFIGKPVTDDHPTEAVTAENWRDHARGTIMGALRDGEYLAFDILLTDAAVIRKVDAGKRDLSNGYAAEIEFGDFTAPDGTKCQARQARITDGNHVALVRDGRAGKECAIRDRFAECEPAPKSFLDSLSQEKPTMKITIGDKKDVDLSDGAAVALAVGALNSSFADALARATAAETKTAELTTALATKDAEIVTLKQAVADAKLTPAALRDAAKAYAGVCSKATALGVKFAADADADAIMKAVVDAKMGDAAKGWNAEQIAASFAVLTKDAKVSDAEPIFVRPTVQNDAAANFEAAQRKLSDQRRNAWKNTAPAAAA